MDLDRKIERLCSFLSIKVVEIHTIWSSCDTSDFAYLLKIAQHYNRIHATFTSLRYIKSFFKCQISDLIILFCGGKFTLEVTKPCNLNSIF